MRDTYAVERFTESPRIKCSVSMVASMANTQQRELLPWSFTGVVFSNKSIVGDFARVFRSPLDVHEPNMANATSMRIILFMIGKDTIFS